MYCLESAIVEVEFEFVFWPVFLPPTCSHNSNSEVA